MCGLCGVTSRFLNRAELEVFQDLLTVSTIRGRYGAGIAALPSKFESTPQILRTEWTGAALANSEELDQLFKTQMTMIMGHTRAPTTGTFEIKHVHPFRVKHIVGVHNGTFGRVMGNPIKDGESDSETFYSAVAEVGIEEAIKESTGAYSLVWYDSEELTLNFLRNSLRPLYVHHPASTTHVSTLYWASEASMLELCVSRKHNFTRGEVQPTKVDRHYSIKMYGRGNFEIMEAPLAGRASFPVTYTRGYHGSSAYGIYSDGDWERELEAANKSSREKKVKETTRSGSTKTHAVVPYVGRHDPLELPESLTRRPKASSVREITQSIEEVIPGWYRTVQEIFRNLQEGCRWCGRPEILKSHHKKEIYWWTPDAFRCSECQKSAMVCNEMEGLYGPAPARPEDTETYIHPC